MKTILIIDDEEELRQLLRITFDSSGYSVITAANGEEGWKLAMAKRPDAIVLDIKMPKMNGYEFIARLKKEPKLNATPIIVFTSITDGIARSDQEWAKSLEVEDFISKPMEPFELLDHVQRVIESRCRA